MKRRQFLLQGPVAAAGLVWSGRLPSMAGAKTPGTEKEPGALYALFQDPPDRYRPFVRWWWNGDKVNQQELARELEILRQAGIGGVEINPIKFPLTRDELDVPALTWLSPEWIDMLDFALKEARSKGLTADLIVGSGWPFGAEYLQDGQRSQAMVLVARPLTGPLHYEASLFDLFKEADPAITSPFPGRKMEMVSVHIVPGTLQDLKEAKDLSGQIPSGTIVADLPEGDFFLYGLVKIEGFQEVINGAPGASGPVLNHYDREAVTGFLHRMSDGITGRIGSLSGRIRSLFTDSLELEGANWTTDMEAEFSRRRGYDLTPWLPFILFKIGSMGNTYDYQYGAALGETLANQLGRVRYDFDLTLSELLRERFFEPFLDWCRENGVQSRVQAYGRGYQPLEGSFGADIPECETWIQYGVGTDMSNEIPKKGRAYTVVNKFVSSAAHLEGKRLISCEELTNIYMVFNTTLETCKVAADQSLISGTTQPVFHGFGYSPPDAPFPGWVRYGTFLNEKNPWWPYFKLFTDYKARLSAFLQQGDLYADIALLAPVADLWTRFGAQNDPFPFTTYPVYQSLVWEAIHRNGHGCDYVSEKVIRESTIRDGWLCYGPRRYRHLFLIKVSSLEPDTVAKLLAFVSAGGGVYCLETFPDRAPGWADHPRRDAAVRETVERLKAYPERFRLLEVPEDQDFTAWFGKISGTCGIRPYVAIDRPDPFVSQVRYSFADAEALFFINSDAGKGRSLTITPSPAITRGRYPWLWDPHTGQRYRLPVNGEAFRLELGPADAALLVFDRSTGGKAPEPLPTGAAAEKNITHWKAEFHHVNGTVHTLEMEGLKDLREIGPQQDFAGTVIYRAGFVAAPGTVRYLNLGRVAGIAEVSLNGKPLGVQWFGRRIYRISETLRADGNVLEVRVTTILGNYLKTLKDNPVGQYWTNEGSKIQPFQPAGLIGPVTYYS